MCRKTTKKKKLRQYLQVYNIKSSPILIAVNWTTLRNWVIAWRRARRVFVSQGEVECTTSFVLPDGPFEGRLPMRRVVRFRHFVGAVRSPRQNYHFFLSLCLIFAKGLEKLNKLKIKLVYYELKFI